MREDKIAQLKNSIFEAYTKKTLKSKQMYERACRSLAGGLAGSGSLYQPYPIYMKYAKGSRTYDVDGYSYIDCFLCAGPLILGHSHPEIMDQIKQQMDKGLLIHNPDLAVECAELLKQIVPCAEKVRFVNTGTDACIFAAKFARAFTKKNKIVKFYGHFHGSDDQFMIGTATNRDEPVGAGISEAALKNTVMLRFNDIDAIRRKLDEDDDVAGIILDPQGQYGGIWPPSIDYLKELRQLTEDHGVVLIFDEVITGFRLALGGAQEYFGVVPDLAVFAKGIAAGAKLAAVVGKEEIMSVVVPQDPLDSEIKKSVVAQSGTFRDGTMGYAAAIAAMNIYRKMNEIGQYEALHQMGNTLKSDIETAFRKRGIPCHVNNLGPSLKIFLTDLEPSFEAYCHLDQRLRYLFFLSVITEGVLLSAPNSGSIFLSFAHTKEDLQNIIKAVNSSLDKNKFQEALQD